MGGAGFMLFVFFSETANKGENIITLSSLSRHTAARDRVVQGRGAHQSGQDSPVPGAGRGQPANQRSPAGRHGHVPVLRPQSGRRDPDQHLPGCYK